MKLTVIGTGYVGLVSGACFAETGNDVICVDNDAAKIERIQKGEIPFYEPGLAELIERNRAEGRLLFSTDTAKSVRDADVTFICVGTPSRPDGAADLQYVFAVAEAVAKAETSTILTTKSTVPVGTADRVWEIVRKVGNSKVRVASNPEFLREGSAVQDCLTPDRIVIGTEDPKVAKTLSDLYAPYVRTGRPVFIMNPRTAEMTKYAANALLAQRISFMNEIATLCEEVGADVTLVRKGISADHRIGSQYLFPSVGFGGSCFPKDVRALVSLAEESHVAPRLLKATLDVNEAQKKRFVDRVVKSLGGADGAKGKTIAIWGVSFKAKTDDIRESPALTVIDGLLAAGAKVALYDPVSLSNAQKVYGDRATYVAHEYDVLEGAHAVCVLTEWNQFRTPDFSRMKKMMAKPVIFDGRNLYEPEEMKRLGFAYHSVGRESV